ncbi:Glutaredoxin-related protein 5, mitochondrial [Frankliniella fusca]|uniref:Glutaredoxin-related protein 5, mitochondrial n=1 Tax=Frankliniella fusca TaxID=407009 RepID=A0AAE1H8X0_9NEOP|nr:Glutaredoxin-related protein 5, mitochondrial [Frankliniella fusca]
MSVTVFSQMLRQATRFNKSLPALAHLRYYGSEDDRISKLVQNNKVVVFMKGVPAEPRCGFSNAVVQIMRMHGVEYDAHDVLADEKLRQGIKDFSSWPTIPQVFINGEFVGGCDILLQMHQSGDLIEELKKAGITSALLDAAQQKKDNSGKSESK